MRTESEPAPNAWPVGKHSGAFLLAAVLLMIVVAVVSLQRPVLVLDVELDYTGNFGVEAQRILDGTPLKLNYHPPGYAFAVALAQRLANDWMAAGLWLSGISALVFLLASASATRRLFGAPGAWGALVGCACSLSFLRFGTTASSDMYFAALCATSIALVLRAHDRSGPLTTWMLAGVVAGLAVLARTNGAVLVVALPLACLLSAAPGARLKIVSVTIAGMLVPVMLWTAYALATGSQMLPVGSHINLAVQAYGGPESFHDEAARFAQQFPSTFAVLAHDPVEMAVRFAKRLIALPVRLAQSLTWLPLSLLAIPGLFIAFRRKPLVPLIIYCLLAGFLTFAVGFLSFKDRMHLLLIPVIGALAGVAVAFFIGRWVPVRARTPVMTGAIALIATYLIAANVGKLRDHRIENGEKELTEAIPRAAELIEPDATIYSRGSSLNFQIGRPLTNIPNVQSASALEELLCRELGPDDVAYLYLGQGERHSREALVADIGAPGTTKWLVPVAAGRETDWDLYRIRLFGPAREQAGGCTR